MAATQNQIDNLVSLLDGYVQKGAVKYIVKAKNSANAQ